ncbi:hypothetical protein ACQPVP_01970 [Clostridium nigeriense]|uniref:hypothetical protein n=1 Tax=Clostridium nigeriense TaxID=1805470 RepID=UPI003D3469B7
MKKLLIILPIIAFSLLIIDTVPVKSESILNNFYFLEDEVINTGDFIENGVRVEYSSKNSLENELLIVENNLRNLLKEDIYIDGNNIFFSDNQREIKVLAWKDEKETKVQITYINNRKECTINQIKKEIEQIQYFAAENIKYFDFIKVKIIEEQKQNLLDILKSNIKEKTLEELNIVNGKVGKGKLKDGNKINYSFMTYDTGEYLILGTPVIFITY